MENKRAVAALCGAVLAACGSSAPDVIRTTSEPAPPAWKLKPPTGSGDLFFVGSKEGAGSLEEGQSAAMDHARDQAAQFIGVNISSEHKDVMDTQGTNAASEAVQSKAAALIRSASMDKIYYEKFSRQVGATTVDRFDVWVLLKLPRGAVQEERARQKEDAKNVAKSSLARLKEAQTQEQQGHLVAALVRYRDVAQNTKPLALDTETGDASFPTAGRLHQAAEDAAAAAQAKVRRAILVADSWVAAALTQALSAKGFAAQARSGLDEGAARAAAKAEGIPWVIVARAQTTPGGAVFSQVAATLALDVRALDAQSGAIVASSPATAKGIGRTQDAAAQQAATEAGAAAGNDLAAKLMAQEKTGL